MNLSHLSNQEVNSYLLVRVENERKNLKEILEGINEASSRRLYLEMGYSSLFQYCVKFLKYSEALAYQRINSAQVLVEIPEIGEKLDEGSINITQLSNFQTAVKAQEKLSHVSVENKKEILFKLENTSSSDTKKALVQSLPTYEPKPKKEIRYKRDESVQMTLNPTKEQFAKLEAVRALLSHKVPDQDLMKVIEVLCDQEIKRRTQIRESQMKTQAQEISKNQIEKQIEVRNQNTSIQNKPITETQNSHTGKASAPTSTPTPNRELTQSFVDLQSAAQKIRPNSKD